MDIQAPDRDRARPQPDPGPVSERGGPIPVLPKLIVLRGNSGSGKSTVARAIRDAYGGRGCAIIDQDYLRRIVLREHDQSDADGIAPQFIAHAARFTLEHGFHTIVEGILATTRYKPALVDLPAGHPGDSFVYYLDTSFAETIRRHRSRPQVDQFTPSQMRDWFKDNDRLGVPGETVIRETSTVAGTVDQILTHSGLRDAPPTTYCPTGCPRCQEERR